MKKKDIISLIRYYSEKNDEGFRNQAYQIARDFDQEGDSQLAEYIMSLLSDANVFVPQDEGESAFLERLSIQGDSLYLPESITQDLMGIVHAVRRHMGIHKFLFEGTPGTGKTEAAKQLGRLTGRELYMVNSAALVDSRLGRTSKNISDLLDELNHLNHPEKVIVLFDELDSIALDRTNPNDIREMGRVTTAFLNLLDRLNPSILVIATTNLYAYVDKAIIRRFDAVVDFDRYSKDDLVTVSENILVQYLMQFRKVNRNMRLFRKILDNVPRLPMPGDMRNIIRTSLAFSDPDDGNDYFRRLYVSLNGNRIPDISELQHQGYTVREIEILTKIPKSSVDRWLKEAKPAHA
jgi:hypothetical protein